MEFRTHRLFWRVAAVCVVAFSGITTARARTVYVSTSGNDADDGLSWGTAKLTVQAGLNAAAPGDQVWVAAGTYIENVTLTLGVELYGGFAGTETALAQRDWVANAATLDGNQAGSVVTAPSGATETTRIDGFTIRNGNRTIGDYGNRCGGGLFLSESSPTITNNTIAGNSASYGGGLYLSNSSPTITNNTITGNRASCGGGLYLSNSSPTLASNTITGNDATYGGGLYQDYSFPIIANTIVAFNSSGIYAGSGVPTLRCNCVYGNTAYNYSGLSDPTGTDGNLSADPKFADPAHQNLHVQPDSPCKDAGSDSDVQAGWLDMDGQPRIQGTHVDIGADESDGTVWTSGPGVIVRVSLSGNDVNDGSSWALSKRTVQAGIDAASATGGDVWVAGGTYLGQITLRPHAYIYGGFSGSETQRDQRNWVSNVTILDGQQSGSVVTAVAGYHVSGIDGFTIRNGSESGLYLRYSSPIITNNTITGNSASTGGGLYLEGSSPTITNNTITDNIASSGGGLYVSNYSSPTITNNTITGNCASYSGGGLLLSSCLGTITNNMITGNSASDNGGGLCLFSSSATIANNTITSNSASYGGGLCLYSSSSAVTNTIIAFNSSGIHQYDGTATLCCNCVYGNAGYDYSGLADPTGADGNIKSDPKLANASYANVHIQPDSPCKDTGNDSDVQPGWLDMDGQPRIQGTHVDIGADESDKTVWTSGPGVIVRVSLSGNDVNDGSSWALSKRTVQAGIDAASATGGDVWVAGGTYLGQITLRPHAYIYGGFSGSETQRDQRNWVSNVTILDGQRGGSVVTAVAGYHVSGIDGFTIRNGSESGLYLRYSSPIITNNTITGNSASTGGGLYLEGSSPTITNNTIMDNSAAYGGGLSLSDCSSTITNNTISNNSASYDGGGLYLEGSSPTIANNTITGNSASSDGGGLYLSDSSSPTITSNTIAGNSASHGGGLHLFSSSATIANNTITGNGASGGGGLYLEGSSPTITNNTITDNGGSYGGGLYLSNSSSTIANNTIIGNSASYGGGLCLHSSSPAITNTIVAFNSSGVYGSSGTPTLRYNCVYGNAAYNYSGLSDPTGADGNLSADPKFADPAHRNLHVQPDSPCKDAGSDSDAQAGWLDMDGQPQIQGTHVDIGADESDGTVWTPQPNVIVRVSLAGDDANDGSSWALAKQTVQAGIDAASPLGGEVWVAGGAYLERITLRPHAHIYGGFSGSETQRDQRNWVSNVTILDGQQSGSVVRAIAGYHVSGIDGFTIRNGSESGLYLRSSSPTIANNTICENWSRQGGGIFCEDYSSPTIIDNTITDNLARGYGQGGGICCLDGSSPTIARNRITNNSAGVVQLDGGEGGGVYCWDSSPTITNNTITGNNAVCYSQDGGDGGGIYCSGSPDSPPQIIGNTIKGNGAGVCGGGIYCEGWGRLTIISNTIIENWAGGEEPYGRGGAGICSMGSYDYDRIVIANNKIVGNVVTGWANGGGLWCDGGELIVNNTIATNSACWGGGIYLYGSATIVNTIVAYNSSGIYSGGQSIRNNCVYGNMPVFGTSLDNWGGTDLTGTNGNISVDPGLTGITFGDAHLPAGSACIDAGDDTVVQSEWTDMDGQARTQGGRVDIGADEYTGADPGPSVPVIIFVSQLGDDANDGSSWALAKQTVQAAIDAAATVGGEVWVKTGTYTERITLPSFVHVYGGFSGSEVQRAERDWAANQTVLDGNNGGSVVTISLTGCRVNTIDGFTIRNGTGTLETDTYGSRNYGGGIYGWYASPTIANNTIVDNVLPGTADRGGGICLFGSYATIANNAIRGNKASSGGGIYYTGAGGSPRIINNLIIGNGSTSASQWSGSGGGIYSGGAMGYPTIANNMIAGNMAGYGGGIYGAFPTIANNTILANVAYQGAGIYGYMEPIITNNTVSGNIAASDGGGIYMDASASSNPYSIIANTIVAFNSSGVYRLPRTPPTSNCVFGNGAYNWHHGDPTGTNGNISVDPRLVGLGIGASHIVSGSPCINAGDDSVVVAGWTDIDGQARTTGAHVDIGADEFDGTVWSDQPNVVVRVTPDGNDANDGSSWGLAKRTVQAGIDAAAQAVGEVWVKAGTYDERINLRAFAHVYGGFAGNEAERSARNWSANVTVLDGGQAGSVVTASGFGAGVSTIDGFTIRNGTGTVPWGWSGKGGGGILCQYSAPTITNNLITRNSAPVGGGLCSVDASPTILGNTITRNDAEGIRCYTSSPTIASNVIAGNYGSSGGRGIYCKGGSAKIVGNTIVGHPQEGIYCSSGSPTITNTILAFNYQGIGGYSGAPHTLRHNCIYGNILQQPDLGGADGNFSTAPLFVRNPSLGPASWYGGAEYDCGDLHLAAGSPCIDAGDDTVVQTRWTDADGQARILGTHVDIGADESDGSAPPPAPSPVIRVAADGDDSNDGSSWALPKRMVQAAIDSTTVAGTEIWVKGGTYTERIMLTNYVQVYGGYAGTETQRNQRNWVANATILDGTQGGSVVTVVTSSTLDGFTIRNGSASSGGGICCPCFATIANNTIMGNNACDGGGIYCGNSFPSIVNNTIIGNNASTGGGAIHCSAASPLIANNMITGNNSPDGGGIYCSGASPSIVNNIIAYNSSGLYKTGSGTLALRFNCVCGNRDYDYSGLTDPTGTDGSISADPLLVQAANPGSDGVWGTDDDVAGDPHLLAGSPCINAGDPAYVQANGETDMDCQPRVLYGRVDIGADEYRLAGDCNYDGYVNVGDLQSLVAAWGSQIGPPPIGSWNPAADINSDGYVNVGDLQLLVTNWGTQI